MRNVIIALAAAGILAAALPSPVHANCNGCGVAAGVVGGLAAGAIVGSAIANNRPVYLEPAPVCRAATGLAVPPRMTARLSCRRQQVWDDAYRTRRQVCD
jgi:hypothetical protein